MIADYFTRLVWLSLAAFFAVHLLSGLAVILATPWAVRMAERLRPRFAARVLLTMRLLPVALGAFTVAALCVPSYLWLEPGETGEQVGAAGVLAGASALAILLLGAARGLRVWLRSRHYLKSIPSDAPVLAMAGVVRPRMLVSRFVRERLSRPQLAAAMRHERAHGRAWDNGKRLLLALAPGLLPGIHGFTALDGQWGRFAEWAADDDAAQGDPVRSLALASALVRIARFGPAAIPLASSLLEGDHLAERVHRLLNPAPPQPWDGQPVVITAAAVMTVAASIAGVALRPTSLEYAHEMLEQLIR